MYIGIDVGGTSIKYGLVDEEGVVTHKSTLATSHNRIEFLDNIIKLIQDLSIQYPDVKAVGICAPGIIEKNGLMTTAGALKALYGINLKDEIQKFVDLPVQIENDANAVAIAERWVGNAKGIDNYLCLVLGTGVGGGIVINGDVYRGKHGMAGEFGWMIIDRFSSEEDMESASVNQRAAIVGGLCLRYNKFSREKNSSFEGITDAKLIFEREATDELAQLVISQFFKDLSVSIINLISCFDPELVLIGGGISENDRFFDRLQKEVLRWEKEHASVNYLIGQTIAPIKQTKLKNDAGIIGSVYPIRRTLKLNS
ncbi:ROK family protein [Fundicoccus sp. Sow4_F4]|uniref:ROK family protein n=1 Tax=Fundicoccus sp. Sow4_F4 TaxID=3438783 RepID=UPI003F907794